MAKRSMREALGVEPGQGPPPLEDLDPGATPGTTKKAALRTIQKERARLFDLQLRLFAEARRSLLLVLQGVDTSGKDGTITHVIGGMNPQGVRIQSFRKPTPEELRHDFLWRIQRALPHPGQVGIFNRSHYEDVLVVRVHRLVPKSEWATRFDEINRFEAQLARAGTAVVKVLLHISYEEQRKRLLARLEDPAKRWKFNERDLAERRRWAEYQRVYHDALSRCSTDAAPWFIVPANRNWYRNWAVTKLLVETLDDMDPRFPEPEIDVAKFVAQLKSEPKKAPAGGG